MHYRWGRKYIVVSSNSIGFLLLMIEQRLEDGTEHLVAPYHVVLTGHKLKFPKHISFMAVDNIEEKQPLRPFKKKGFSKVRIIPKSNEYQFVEFARFLKSARRRA